MTHDASQKTFVLTDVLVMQTGNRTQEVSTLVEGAPYHRITATINYSKFKHY